MLATCRVWVNGEPAARPDAGRARRTRSPCCRPSPAVEAPARGRRPVAAAGRRRRSEGAPRAGVGRRHDARRPRSVPSPRPWCSPPSPSPPPARRPGRSWRKRREDPRPYRPVAVLGATVVRPRRRRRARWPSSAPPSSPPSPPSPPASCAGADATRTPKATIAIALLIGVRRGAPVGHPRPARRRRRPRLRRRGSTPSTPARSSSGTGASNTWEGPVAGAASAAAIGLAVAAVLVPAVPRRHAVAARRSSSPLLVPAGTMAAHDPPRTRRGAGARAPAPRCVRRRGARLGRARSAAARPRLVGR